MTAIAGLKQGVDARRGLAEMLGPCCFWRRRSIRPFLSSSHPVLGELALTFALWAGDIAVEVVAAAVIVVHPGVGIGRGELQGDPAVPADGSDEDFRAWRLVDDSNRHVVPPIGPTFS